MIAGGNAAHGREPPLQIVGDIHTVIAMTECCFSFSSEPVSIGDRSPNVQIEPFLVSESIWPHGNAISALSHFCMRGKNIAGAFNEPCIYSINPPIALPREIMLDEPFNLCCRKIARVADFNMRHSFIAISQHVNASGANSQISALQYLGIFPLLSGNDGQEEGIKRQEDRGERKNLIVIGLDSGREPLPVSSDRREEFRKHGIAICTNPPMNRILPLRSRGAAPSGFIEPCLPSPADRPPSGPGWIHEIKHDGFRLMARRDAAGVRLLTRNGHDWAGRYPQISEAAGALQEVRSFLIDGEAVACDGDGMPSFDRLRYRRADGAVFLFAFDLLELNGDDLRREPIELRKRELAKLLRNARLGLQVNEHIAEPGDVVFRHACKLGLEGIVSKRLGSRYRSGRSPDWLKMKNPAAPAVKREAEEDWGRGRWR